jgi:hypothetical protein
MYVRTKLFLPLSPTFCPPFCALEFPSLNTSLTPCPMLLTCANRPIVSTHIAGDADGTHQSYDDCSGLMVWFREHSSLRSRAHLSPHFSHLSLRPELPLTTSSSPSLEVSVSVWYTGTRTGFGTYFRIRIHDERKMESVLKQFNSGQIMDHI